MFDGTGLYPTSNERPLDGFDRCLVVVVVLIILALILLSLVLFSPDAFSA
jgi:hypothetical protein